MGGCQAPFSSPRCLESISNACSKFVAKESPNRERDHEIAADWANDAIQDLARLFGSRERDGIDQITAINPHPGGKLSESLGGSTT